MSKILILGMGMQGQAVLYDIMKNDSSSTIIHVADSRPDLELLVKRYSSSKISFHQIDARHQKQLIPVMKDADIVICALPAPFSLSIARLAVKYGIHFVSSSYLLNQQEKDQVKIRTQQDEMYRLDQEAKKKELFILAEFGMDPGIDLALGAQALKELDHVNEFYSYGAGFPTPEAATNPLKYKFSWSIIGVMRSYLRPAEIISGGKIVTIEARDMFASKNIHLLNIPEIGAPLECFPNGSSVKYAERFGIKNSVQEMARYVCRWQGHCAFWEIMAKCSFLDEQPIYIGEHAISPVEFTSALLGSQHQFYYRDNEQDIALIRVDVRGLKDGKKKHIIFQLIDRRDLKTGFTAMQRTVGFTMSMGARLILDSRLTTPGLLSPIDVPFGLIAPQLEKHGMKITHQEMTWDNDKK